MYLCMGKLKHRCALPSVRMERPSAVLLLQGYSVFEIQLDIFRPGTGKPRVSMRKQEALSFILSRDGGHTPQFPYSVS